MNFEIIINIIQILQPKSVDTARKKLTEWYPNDLVTSLENHQTSLPMKDFTTE